MAPGSPMGSAGLAWMRHQNKEGQESTADFAMASVLGGNARAGAFDGEGKTQKDVGEPIWIKEKDQEETGEAGRLCTASSTWCSPTVVLGPIPAIREELGRGFAGGVQLGGGGCGWKRWAARGRLVAA